MVGKIYSLNQIKNPIPKREWVFCFFRGVGITTYDLRFSIYAVLYALCAIRDVGTNRKARVSE